MLVTRLLLNGNGATRGRRNLSWDQVAAGEIPTSNRSSCGRRLITKRMGEHNLNRFTFTSFAFSLRRRNFTSDETHLTANLRLILFKFTFYVFAGRFSVRQSPFGVPSSAPRCSSAMFQSKNRKLWISAITSAVTSRLSAGFPFVSRSHYVITNVPVNGRLIAAVWTALCCV